MSTLSFPSSGKVQAAVAAAETKTMRWSELPTGTVYGITHTKQVQGKFGKSVVGDLETQDGERYKAWLPQRLASDVSDHKLPVFVLHKGLKQSERDKSRQFYDYMVIEN